MSHLRVAAAISIVVTASAVALLCSPKHYAWIGDQTGYAPLQPIEFSHKVHATDNSIPCEYCHFNVRKAAVAGIPPAGVCMNCHSGMLQPATEGEQPASEAQQASSEAQQPPSEVQQASSEVQKIVDALESDRPIEWIRVHDLQDFVYFDHSAHVNKGVECQTCHGPVETMARVEQTRHLNMGWCVACHREYTAQPPEGMTDVAASTECSVCHF